MEREVGADSQDTAVQNNASKSIVHRAPVDPGQLEASVCSHLPPRQIWAIGREQGAVVPSEVEIARSSPPTQPRDPARRLRAKTRLRDAPIPYSEISRAVAEVTAVSSVSRDADDTEPALRIPRLPQIPASRATKRTGAADNDRADNDRADSGITDSGSIGESGRETTWQPDPQPARAWWPPRRTGQSLGASVVGRRRVTAVILLVGLLALASAGAVSAFQQYSQVRAEAADGLLHLKQVQALLAPELAHPGIPDPATLAAVERELAAAEHDFALTRRDLERGIFSIASGVPAAGSALAAVAALSAAADEACLAGLDLVREARILMPVMQSDLFAGSASSSVSSSPQPASLPSPQAPALTAAMVQRLTADFEDAARRLTLAIAYAHSADLSALPANLITAQQRAQLHTLLAAWPRIAPALTTVDAWLHVAPALLGLNGPTRLLVELMDRGETRATGGYIGDYGVMTIQNGKLAPFSLIDVYKLDIPYAVQQGWPDAPVPYTWWPFHGFGLRDSNLSPNFPTAAQKGIHQLAAEGGPAVQGVVALDAPVIARVLQVVGPVTVPAYNQVVTAENLEALTRLYTENPQVRLTSRHELFTIQLGHAFMTKLHGLSSGQMVAIAQAMLSSLHTKDLQVYLSDPAAEALLARQGLDGALTQGPSDGLTIIDDNLSGNKSNLFTTLTSTDAVTLDEHGMATHHLSVTYLFDTATNPAMRSYLYGRRVYRAYLRVYAPPSAQLVSLDGFSRRFEQINTSDEPGRAMWGGYVYVHDGIPYVLQFIWSVPNAATQDAAGHWHYTLIVQHQAGANQQLALSVTAPGEAQPLISYTGAPDQDRTFSL